MSPRALSSASQAIAAAALSLPYHVEPYCDPHKVIRLYDLAYGFELGVYGPSGLVSRHFTRASADAECRKLNGRIRP